MKYEIDNILNLTFATIKRRYISMITQIKFGYNFDINIYGGKYIARGYDKERNMYYYRFFF